MPFIMVSVRFLDLSRVNDEDLYSDFSHYLFKIKIWCQSKNDIYLKSVASILKINDMLPQSNWPEGHNLKADHLIATLEQRRDLRIVKISWASGIILATKI